MNEIDRRFEELWNSLDDKTKRAVAAIAQERIQSAAPQPVSAPAAPNERGVMEQALKTFDALLNDIEGSGSWTQIDDDLLPDVQASATALRAALAGEAAGGLPEQPPPAGFKFPYQATFDAIVKAIEWRPHWVISISVEKFQEAFNAHLASAEATPMQAQGSGGASYDRDRELVGRENTAFSEWWDANQACPEHSLTTENAARATWHERARRAFLAKGENTATGRDDGCEAARSAPRQGAHSDQTEPDPAPVLQPVGALRSGEPSKLPPLPTAYDWLRVHAPDQFSAWAAGNAKPSMVDWIAGWEACRRIAGGAKP